MENIFNLFYETSGISTDTRKIEKDCMFVCLKGANFNGNTFASSALQAGAKYVIVDEAQYQTHENILLVADSLKFLQDLANFHRHKFNIPVIGITGSNGKTSTKELFRSVLSTTYSVLATSGNLNNHIGVPLTLLLLKPHHEIAIIEMGANKFKDIEELCAIAEPTHGIITNIGKAHLEGFLDFEGVLKTKKELYQSVAERNGILFYNMDDEILRSNIPQNVKTISYGTDSHADITGTLVKLDPYVHFSWKTHDYSYDDVETKMIGKYNFYNFLAAVTIGVHFKVPHDKINQAIESYTPDNNRSQVKRTESNTLILDCYNANPSSMRSALESFALIEHANKIFIIGDMLELGKESIHEHKRIVELSNELGLQGYTVGPEFRSVHGETIKQNFSSTAEAAEFLKEMHLKDCLILLKGSRGIGLEKLENIL